MTHTLFVEGGEINVSFIICYESSFTNYVLKIDDDANILFFLRGTGVSY